MPYSLAIMPHHPVVVLHLIGEVEPDTVNRMFNDCARLMKELHDYDNLVIDFGDVTLQSTSRFTEAVIIFHRSSPSIKPKARIQYAFVGDYSVLDNAMQRLGKLGFHAPAFERVEDAIHHLSKQVVQ
jgi:hypothetical protein